MFTFTFSIGSGTSNPFATQAKEREQTAPQTVTRKLPAPPKRPLPPTTEDAPSSKKRGWTPTTSSASEAISQPTLTSGYMDTPAKYLTAASQSHGNGEDIDDADYPPAKRRKTLADSIISTAFSAALISTAVGISAYRMWRDRGKRADEPQSEPVEPPPPYQKDGWVDLPYETSEIRTPRIPRKPRSTRRTPRHRRAPVVFSPARSASPSKSATLQEEGHGDDQLDDQMDWMGDRIRHLINEGQKALGKEIVVMSGEQSNEEEGAVDDGMDGWEEEGANGGGPSSAVSSSFSRSRSRRRIPKSLATNTAASLNASSAFPPLYGSAPTSPRIKRSQIATSGSHSQIPLGWGSPHLDPLRSRPSGFEDVKVIYEPGGISADFHPTLDPSFEDDDSRRLTEGMDAVRKAYKLH